ncbi:MAG: hypothetical protein IT355_11335 [Gemmatimonadaceae bacterium]|nr:hypothetical protein [Gemmatimonadaceae bacterium]
MTKRRNAWIPITVRFASSIESRKSQMLLLERLQQMLDELKQQGHIQDSKIDIVFPDDADPGLARIFVANIQGNSEAAAKLLAQRTGIDYAAVSPARRSQH